MHYQTVEVVAQMDQYTSNASIMQLAHGKLPKWMRLALDPVVSTMN